MNVNGDEEEQAEQEASVHLIILSGGTGSRMHSLKPKQYIDICGKPVISYTLACFDFSLFKSVAIVVAGTWKLFVEKICRTEFPKRNFIFAPAGGSRQESILNGLESLRVGRYHSWVVENLPGCLIPTSVDEEGEIMSLKHASLDVRGVQFHPESIMTPCGKGILSNWLNG